MVLGKELRYAEFNPSPCKAMISLLVKPPANSSRRASQVLREAEHQDICLLPLFGNSDDRKIIIRKKWMEEICSQHETLLLLDNSERIVDHLGSAWIPDVVVFLNLKGYSKCVECLKGVLEDLFSLSLYHIPHTQSAAQHLLWI